MIDGFPQSKTQFIPDLWVVCGALKLYCKPNKVAKIGSLYLALNKVYSSVLYEARLALISRIFPLALNN